MKFRNHLKGAVLALALVGATGPVLAQDSTPSTGVFKTAQQVYDLCTSSNTAELEGCDYFIMSAHDMMKYYGDTEMGGGRICVPMGTTALELRKVMIADWEADLAGRKYSAVSTIYNALVDKYPCD